MQNASDLFVKALANEGVKTIYGVPGEENIDFLEAIRKFRRIRFIPTRHEQSAAFMADVEGRLTGKAGVCLSTLGPGVTNLATGIADATLDHAPVVSISGQLPRAAMHKRSQQFFDVVAFMRPITKWATRVLEASTVPEIVRKAFTISQEERPGAVHIELPEDVAEMEISSMEILQCTHVTAAEPSDTSIARAWQLIARAKRPILFAGNGCVRMNVSRTLTEFCHVAQIPLVTTIQAKGIVDPRKSKEYLWTSALRSPEEVTAAFDEADCVIVVGYDYYERHPKLWNRGKKKVIIYIDPLPPERSHDFEPAWEVLGHIDSALKKLIRVAREHSVKPRPAWEEYITALGRTIRSIVHEHDADSSWPPKPQRIIADVRRVLRDTDILISDVGAHKLWIGRNYEAYRPNTCIIGHGLASMGIALPGAIAAKLLFPKRTVLALVGDGGFLMALHELETAVRLKLPIVVLVWRDNGYGMIDWHQRKKFGKSFGVDFGNPDFVQLAESFGAVGLRVKKTDDILSLLKKAVKAKKPVVIDCPVDYRENMKLTERLKGMMRPV